MDVGVDEAADMVVEDRGAGADGAISMDDVDECWRRSDCLEMSLLLLWSSRSG